MNYIIVKAICEKDLCCKVNSYIEEGYIPIGGFLKEDSILSDTCYYQAMVKKEILK